MRGSPEFKWTRPNIKKLADINAYKNSKLLNKSGKRAGSSLASYQGREMLKKNSLNKTALQAKKAETCSQGRIDHGSKVQIHRDTSVDHKLRDTMNIQDKSSMLR